MKICCISDTHGKHNKLDMSKYPADVLIHAGDWTAGRDIGLQETKDFLEWFSKQPYNHKICIAGNHEIQVEAAADRITIPKDVIYLENSECTIDNIKFYGSPYSNEFCGWAFMEEEVNLSKIWAKIPEDTNVLITHGPAYDCHDTVARPYGRDPHVGSTSLTKRKQMLTELRIHVCGHIHESSGVSGTNPININAAVLNEHYKMVNEPKVVEIPSRVY